MAKNAWDDADIAKASEALDAELDKIFKEAGGALAEKEAAPEDNIPDAEILPDDDDLDDDDYDAPEAFIIDDDDSDSGDGELTLPGPISREELADIIEKAVERGIMSALKKLGKI